MRAELLGQVVRVAAVRNTSAAIGQPSGFTEPVFSSDRTMPCSCWRTSPVGVTSSLRWSATLRSTSSRAADQVSGAEECRTSTRPTAASQWMGWQNDGCSMVMEGEWVTMVMGRSSCAI
ncbi:hypothetical protein BJF78_24585 [Pseudonocardia sp. CNS-139]|nr:hypothetical protein BJF78_24585 [Pseudonocardia sp. CNS-139]